MQAFNRTGAARRIVMSCLVLFCGLALYAAAQPAHQHGAGAELGISAAVDAAGRLWVAGKEASADGQYVALQVSSDMGKTWSPPRRIQGKAEAISADGENRPKLAFGPKGEMYISYTSPLGPAYTGNVRFIRSLDGGKTFSPPMTVHANRDVVAHRFDSMIVDTAGRIFIAWIDKRDTAGAALYYAVSEDRGATFKGDYKIADHSCECCRIPLALNPAGRPVVLWRHVYAQNVRDHAFVELTPGGRLSTPVRATFDNWKADSCPHHGPALAYAPDGTRHQAWFNIKGDEGGIYYAAAKPSGALQTPMRLGSELAQYPDIVVRGKMVAVAWKQFDGKSTVVMSKLSRDGGHTWEERELARNSGESDHPRLVATPAGILLLWRMRDSGIQTIVIAHGA